MSNQIRDFLSLSYGELEERNLAAKEQRNKARSARQDSGRAPQVPDGREEDQGCSRYVQRP